MNEQTAWAILSRISDTITTINWGSPAWMYLERVPAEYIAEPDQVEGIRLDQLPEQSEDRPDFDAWERGRVFDAGQELKWERRGGDVHAVYCGASPPAAFTSVTLPVSAARDGLAYLWGQNVRDKDRALLGLDDKGAYFVELRVPRILRYPVGLEVRRVQVQLRELIAADGGLVYARWAGLQEAS